METKLIMLSKTLDVFEIKKKPTFSDSNNWITKGGMKLAVNIIKLTRVEYWKQYT